MAEEGPERCRRRGCGHPASEHVNDKVMHEGQWLEVSRCCACERDGGPCTDAKAIMRAHRAS